MFVVQAASKGLVCSPPFSCAAGVGGGWGGGQGGREVCLWSVLLLETLWRPQIHVPTDCGEQESYLGCDIND